MRLALQAVLAKNTLLRNPESTELAREFYESRLLDSASTHPAWTRGYYAQAWPGPSQPFWRDRSIGSQPTARETPEMITRFRAAYATLEAQETNRPRPIRSQNVDETNSPASLMTLLQA
jgi:hypothetical protein